MAPQPAIFLLGGAGDRVLSAVKSCWKEYRAQDPGRPITYFSHNQGNALRAAIEALPEDCPVHIAGHSWGGDTAAQVTAALGLRGKRVALLVTVDPVGRGLCPAFFRRVRDGTEHWINVWAVGTGRYHYSDTVARIGGCYGTGPRGHAHRFIEARVEHKNFRAMMAVPLPDGAACLIDLVLSRAQDGAKDGTGMGDDGIEPPTTCV